MSELTASGILIVLIALSATIAGSVGGAIGYLASRAAYERIVRHVEVEVDVQAIAARISAPVQIDLRVNQPTLEPISVPVEAELVGASSNLELTRRLLDEAPQLGPRALARIFACSTSTAQTYYVQSMKSAGTDVTPAAPLSLAVTEPA